MHMYTNRRENEKLNSNNGHNKIQIILRYTMVEAHVGLSTSRDNCMSRNTSHSLCFNLDFTEHEVIADSINNMFWYIVSGSSQKYKTIF